MTVRRWLPAFLYLLGLGFFLVQLFAEWHQLPARIVINSHPDGRSDAESDRNSFIIVLALTSLLASVAFPGTFWRLRALDPDSFRFPRKDYWRRPENWRRGCDSLFFSSFWLALAQLVFWMGWFSLVVRANRQQPASMDGGTLHTLWAYCTAAVLAWFAYAVWFVSSAANRSDVAT